jgi:hypothetical protein
MAKSKIPHDQPILRHLPADRDENDSVWDRSIGGEWVACSGEARSM